MACREILQFLSFIHAFIQDKDLTEATDRILDLTDRLRKSELSLKECQSRESKLLQETEEYKHRFREARRQNAQLKGKNIKV